MFYHLNFAVVLAVICSFMLVHETVAQEARMFVVIDKFDSNADVSANQFETLRSRIQHRVIGTRKFQVLEREQLKNALSEQRLLDSGVTDAEDPAAPESGKLKAAGFVIYGKILFFGRDAAVGASADVTSSKMTAKVEIQLKITDAETGEVVVSKQVTGVGTTSKIVTEGTTQGGNWQEQIERDAIDNAAALVVDALREHAYPAKVVKVGKKSVTINMTQEEVNEGEIFEVMEIDDEEMVDPDTGESLGEEGEVIGRIQIERPGTKTSTAVPIDELSLDDIEVGFIVRRVNPEVLKREAKQRAQQERKSFKSRF
ncbi:MAG: hypothetical protein IKS83_09760 [Victivallales bacterium]|nr:hypothetical protein [Victivallales bacterium]